MSGAAKRRKKLMRSELRNMGMTQDALHEKLDKRVAEEFDALITSTTTAIRDGFEARIKPRPRFVPVRVWAWLSGKVIGPEPKPTIVPTRVDGRPQIGTDL